MMRSTLHPLVRVRDRVRVRARVRARVRVRVRVEVNYAEVVGPWSPSPNS